MSSSFSSLPKTAQSLLDWTWVDIEGYYADLNARAITAETVSAWLADWSRLSELVEEVRVRLNIATAQNTADTAVEHQYHTYLEHVVPKAQAAEQKLKMKFLESGLGTDGFAIPLRNMKAEASLFRQENLPLLTEEEKLGTEYDRIMGAQTVEWNGKTLTLDQVLPIYQDANRAVRERAWRLAEMRRLADKEAVNQVWVKLLGLRRQIATNAGFADYREYSWHKHLRFDYTPDDALHFHHAVEEVVVPVRTRLLEKRRRRLGVETLRPWDLDVDPLGLSPLRPFDRVDDLVSKSIGIFHRVDPKLGEYFDLMRREKLLDLENRLNKAPGGFQDTFFAAHQPFIFMNAVGRHDDVLTVLHEGGHAFHEFEMSSLPYLQQRMMPMEFSEVASMAMELLASPYLSDGEIGFYSEADAARARVEHLEQILFIWPYVSVGDAFQHWIYTNPDAASDPIHCDAKYAELWDRFMPGLDWSGLEVFLLNRWQRVLHFFKVPFYYLEYALAQLGAVQVWANALDDQPQAVARYRQALALGGTAALPQLFEAAGARFAFDAGTLREATELIERTIEALDAD